MLFESRRILLGFRIKLNFDGSLKAANSYVFVNLSTTPTIGDLLNIIKERFEISQDIYIALNDCRLLNSEDNSVLIDVDEVRIVPCKNEKKITDSNVSQECEILHPNTSSMLSKVKETLAAPISKPPRDKELTGSASCVNEITNRKCRRFYSSIAETMKYLSQNCKLESENASALPNNGITSDEDREGKQNNVFKELQTVQNRKESCHRNDIPLEEIGDNFMEKRKRKRKRKHLKKECESDFNNAISKNQCVDFNNEIYTNSLPNKSARQHIFFERDNDESAETKADSNECHFLNGGCFRIHSCNKKVRQIENNIADMKTDVVDTGVIPDVTDSDHFRITVGDKGEEKQVLLNSVSESDVIPFTQFSDSHPKSACKREYSNVKFLESEDANFLSTISNKHRTTHEKSYESESKLLPDSGFFSTFNSTINDRSNFQTKRIPRGSPDPLATLLLCKQLQSPVEYRVQYTNSMDISRSRSNSCLSVESNKSVNNNSVIDRTSTAPINNGDNECEVHCHYKIVDGKILLRDSCGLWNILTEKEASLKLQPVDEPRENQSITFQVLYLGPDMCPNMSDLICGRVISFHKGNGTLTLSIESVFVENLLKSCGEDAGLPDELVCVAENAYQISWIAVKNPRLLM